MGRIARFALASAANPTLIVAVTVMMQLPEAKLLMLGYVCGALPTSVTLGLVIVFPIEGSRATATTSTPWARPPTWPSARSRWPSPTRSACSSWGSTS
jgi:hypothetical protein